MFNLDSKFKTFYDSNIRLKEAREELRKLKNTNIKRIKDGLITNNSPSFNKCIEQGSMAMSTINKSLGNDYDIDIAVIFEKNDLFDDPKKAKELVLNALNKDCNGFLKSPKIGKNAITVYYSSGEHIDFAVYRKSLLNGEEFYEHAGEQWAERDPKAITDWFLNSNDENNQLRRIVRYLKYNIKKEINEDLPGGLILTILAEETIELNERDDVCLYNTMKNIVNKLKVSTGNLKNPTNENLKIISFYDLKMTNLKKHLEKTLKEIDTMKKDTEIEAISAWSVFFGDEFLGGNKKDKSLNPFKLRLSIVDENKHKIANDISEAQVLPKGLNLCFEIDNSYRRKIKGIKWKIENNGNEARKKGQLKFKVDEYMNKDYLYISTAYKGSHYLICKIKTFDNKIFTLKHNVKIHR